MKAKGTLRRLSGAVIVGVAFAATTLPAAGTPRIPAASGSATAGRALPRTATSAPGVPVACPLPFALEGRALLTGGAIPAASLPGLSLREAGGVPALDVHAYVAPSARAARAAVRTLSGTALVRWAQLDGIRRPTRSTNDPLVKRQWPLSRIGAQAAWDRETGATNPVLVAVLDTGVDASHPDLAGRVYGGFDWVDLDGDPSDTVFHGTAVAGVIAAGTNNKVGMAGVSWGAQILSERVLDGDNGGDDCSIAAGILDATSEGAGVINMSFGGEGDCPYVLQYALDQAHNFGIVLVAAAGNDYRRGNPTQTPANCQGVLGVGATDQSDRIAAFSERNTSVDLVAPGVHVLSTYRDPRTGRPGYAYLDGTSMSAPFVSGVAALLRSRHPTWTKAEVEARLTSTARDLGKKGPDTSYGAGRLDAARALRT